MRVHLRIASVEGATYRGHDGIRRYFEDMDGAWQERHNETCEIEVLGPDLVLTDNLARAVGRPSGVGVELRSAILWELSDGKIVKVHVCPSRGEALEAAGLSE